MRNKKAISPFSSKLTDNNTQQEDHSCIKDAHWQQSLCFPSDNNFMRYLAKMFGGKLALALASRYRVGTSKLWKGATVFWQFDASGTCRAGKIMLYNAETGRRVKEPFNHICWVHALKNEQKQPLYPGYQLKQCLFGEHLLPGNMLDIALVESEKTAILGSHFDQTKLWLATGGKEGLTASRCSLLEDKRVFLYPDAGAESKWDAAARSIFHKYEIVNLPGMMEGSDVGDVWMR